ncbi:MAG TPA: hypothetical protein VEB66_02850 [Opitutaceae bacterium]|nr:hypothetical protein [Opitutaceae bacterium]
MTGKLAALALLVASAWLAGCTTVQDASSARTAAPFEPTLLIIADERGPLTADELAAHRPAIVDYLVRRGYLESPDEVIDNPALASRFIRVILSPGGSFRITEFTLGNRARQVITAGYYPGHSDDYPDHTRYGYYNYYNARPDYPRTDPGPTLAPPASPPSAPAPSIERPRTDERPRRFERRINPEGRGPERSPREHPRNDTSGGTSSPGTPSSPPSSSPPPEPRSSAGESRYEERNRPHDP